MRLKTKEDTKLLSMPELKPNKEWNRKDSRSRRELKLSRLKERSRSENTKSNRRNFVLKEKLKWNLSGLREKNNSQHIKQNKKLPELSI